MISNLSITLFFILISLHLKNGFILSSLFKFVGKEGISEEINFLTLMYSSASSLLSSSTSSANFKLERVYS